jgi:hypothetical protein
MAASLATANATLVALTPAAFEWAREQGHTVLAIDDVVDRRAVLPARLEYHRWQLDWIRRLDDAFDAGGSIIAAAHLLKTPIDSVIVWARLLRAAGVAVAPSELVYAGPPGATGQRWHAGHLQFWPRLGDRPLAAELIEPLAADLGVPVRLDEAGRPSGFRAPPPGFRSGLRARVAGLIGPWRFVRPPRRGARQRGACLMLWSTGYGAAGFAAGRRRDGHPLLFLDRGAPTTRLRRPTWPSTASPPVPVTPFDIPAPASPKALRPFIDEIDQWAGFAGAGDVFAGRLTFFLERVAPAVARAADQLRPAMEAAGVVEVAAANPSSIEEFAALLAASRVSGIRRTLVQHGDHLFPYDFWLVTETQNFDELVISDPTVPGDLARDAAAIDGSVPSFASGSPRVAELRRQGRKQGRDLVVYVPPGMIGDTAFPGDYFEDAWYHRWHLLLLDAMASHPDLRFVWKGLPASDQAYDPMPAIITARNLPNVEYVAEPFRRVLQRAGRVIVDFPSTALYETVHSACPVLGLVFPRFADLRPSAATLFAPILREAHNEAEALAAVEAFLADDEDRWILPASLLDPLVP